ncbi:MAG: TetR/AcrR family transcriptional regulator [Novosphingobium sp.]
MAVSLGKETGASRKANGASRKANGASRKANGASRKANGASRGETGTSPTRRKRRTPEELRDRILGAAAHEFEGNGYAGATTAAIARRAEVTEAQIFRFFPSKAELFREAIFQPLNRHFAEFQDRNAATENAVPRRELAERYINELQEFMERHSRMLMSLIVARAYDQGGSESLPEIEGLKAYFDQGARTMADRTQGVAKVPPELMVRVSFAAVLASVMFRDWLFPAGMGDAAAIRQAIVDFTIDGINANQGNES